MSSLRPSVLRRARPRLAAPAFVAVAAGAGLLAAAPTAVAAGAARLDTRERAVIHRVNAVRADRGLPRLAFGGRLSRAADRHSTVLLRRRTLSHRVAGEAPLARRLARAARVKPIGEVVYFAARGARSADVVRAWMDSPSHRAVLLSPSFGRAGVGIRTGRGGLYVTVDVAAS